MHLALNIIICVINMLCIPGNKVPVEEVKTNKIATKRQLYHCTSYNLNFTFCAFIWCWIMKLLGTSRI